MDTLLSLETVNEEGEEVPNIIPFSEEAEDALFEWQEQDVEENLLTNNNKVDGISAKLYIYVLRFALILQLARYACGEADRNAIDAESAKNAILIAKYFKQTAIEVAGHINKAPIIKLTQLQKDVCAALRSEFKTAEGIVAAEGFGIPPRTFESWLANPDLFLKLSHGVYQKVYKD